MKKISAADKIFIAGSTGMAGKSITNLLKKKGYGSKDLGGSILTPTRSELNLIDNKAVNLSKEQCDAMLNDFLIKLAFEIIRWAINNRP